MILVRDYRKAMPPLHPYFEVCLDDKRAPSELHVRFFRRTARRTLRAIPITLGLLTAATQVQAKTLTAIHPGLMCISPDALGLLTLPNGSSRIGTPRERPGDMNVQKAGGCLSIPQGVHVELQAERHNTSLVLYGVGGSQQTYVVPNIDFAQEPLVAATISANQSPPLAPVSSPPFNKDVKNAVAEPPNAGGSIADQSDPIPPAPQEILYEMLKEMRLTDMDTGVLDAFSAHFMRTEFYASRGNEVKTDLLRRQSLDLINSHKVAHRVMLGMMVQIGDYDVQQQRFRVRYPLYGPAVRFNNPQLVTHQPTHGIPAVVGSQFSELGAYDCTNAPITQEYSNFTAGSYFEVIEPCDQNTHQSYAVDRDVYTRPLRNLIPNVAKVVLAEAPDSWNYLSVPMGQATTLIDKLNGSQRAVWAEIVFDTEPISTTGADLKLNEGDALGAKLKVGAAVLAHPIAIYAWNYVYKPAFGSLGKPPSSFLFAKGSYLSNQPPADGVIRQASVGQANRVTPTQRNPTEMKSSATSSPALVHVGKDVVPAQKVEGRTTNSKQSTIINFGSE